VKGYVLSPAAQADLEDIWNYSVCTWGEDRADRYILGIRDGCGALANGRKDGQSIEAIRPGYRKLAVGSHVLFFRLTDAGQIEVIRILHSKMDVAARLAPLGPDI